MQERWDVELFYYCDEKYEFGHQCKKKHIYLLEGKQSLEKVQDKSENIVNDENSSVSLLTIYGSISHQTMRIHGNIKKKAITILIDLVLVTSLILVMQKEHV